MRNRVLLEVLGIRYTHSQAQVGAYVLILGEVNSIRRIRIIIGTSEAQSIALQLEEITPPRPLTHDLFCMFANEFNIHLKEVFINKFDDGMFFSELLFEDGSVEKIIDARTSDAIALALRVKCPIYTTEEIMRQVGEVFEEDLEQEEVIMEEENPTTLDELQKQLQEAIQNEDYELASAIRDEINRREEDNVNN
ncbi:MAG: bifunctional nuclease family protein [Candidatus Azobacteroides sp.]|nr:bifunctional nuclease family protein [Candidatus Azobacteroides sp.]